MRKILVVWFLTTSFLLCAQTVTLKNLSKKGDVFTMTWESIQRSQRMGAMTLTYELKKTITDANEKSVSATSEVERLLVDISQGGATYRYDSKVENPLSQMGQMLKKQFDPMAKITMMTEVDRYGNLIGSETIPVSQVNAISGFQFYYPTEPIQVDSSWNTSYEDPSGHTVQLTYLVTKMTDATVFIDFKGNSKDKKTLKSEGTIAVDIASGAVEKVVLKTEINSYGGLVKGKTTITSKKTK